jgi:hypothetical protein
MVEDISGKMLGDGFDCFSCSAFVAYCSVTCSLAPGKV